MSLFGQSTSTPSFGTFGQQPTASQQQQTPASSLFGQPQQQQQQAPSLFGAQPAKPALFGSSFGAQQPQQPAAATSSSLFGSQTPAAGSQFGSTQQSGTGTSLFGSAQPVANSTQSAPGSLFGSGTTSNLFNNNLQQQQPAASSALGTTPSAPASGGGLFGSTPTAPAGSLFGSSTTPASGTTGGSLFGSSTVPSSGLFGSSTTTPVNGGLGASTTPSGSLFGNTTTNPSATSLFGQPQQTSTSAGASLFGQQPSQPSNSSLFGQSTAAPSTGLFTSASASFLGSSARPASVGSGQSDPAAQHTLLQKQIEDIQRAWNPQSFDCAFQTYFYNLVDPAQVSFYRRPDNWTNTALWERAVRDNPDPTCMVPVLALGYDDLQRRVGAQDKTQSEHATTLKELSSRLEILSQKHVLSNAVRAARAKSLQTQLTVRIISLVQHLHLLLPSVRSSAIRPEEEALRAALEVIQDELTRPGGMGRVSGKMNELWALVGAVAAQRERERRARSDGPGWTVSDEDGLHRITQILKEQQHGLAHITNILRDDLRDVAIMESGSTASALPLSALFNASQNTLAASTMLRRKL